MGETIIEKILGAHAGRRVKPGDIADIGIDARIARDFGGANVVKNLRDHRLPVADPERTCFTFDCNPTGSDQRYATNQQICRMYARETGIRVHDIDRGIGTHLAIDEGLAWPGSTLVSTDSHANILGAIGAFGQGMGDVDTAHAFAHGRTWFKVPHTVKIVIRGEPSPTASPKDLVLHLCRTLGASGLLGLAAEMYGETVDALGLDGRITMASMATEMGGIIALFPPNREVLDHCRAATGREIEPVLADPDAEYARTVEIDVDGLPPLAARPGHPDDVTEVSALAGTKIGSAFIGSCTNGRLSDLRAAAEILRGRKTAPGVVLKVVPSTDRIWRLLLDEGLLAVLKEAGALVGNAGCAGCAAGQIGQNGPGEVTASTGNRNYPGKQGRGEVYLVSPATAAASAVAGAIVTPDAIPDEPARFPAARAREPAPAESRAAGRKAERPTVLRGRVWIVDRDDIDTDMIFHNRHLAITDPAVMGRYTFGNLEGREDFAAKVRPGDIVVTGANFGCGSSRQQAVDCFASLGVAAIVARSFGAIYERNAVNSGFPVLTGDLLGEGLSDGDEIEVDLGTGRIRLPDGRVVETAPFPEIQMAIYLRGGLLE